MKKLFLIFVVLFGFVSVRAYSANDLEGFFFHIGFCPTFPEYATLNNVLTNQGFTSIGDFSYGLSLGTGMMMQSFYFGWRLNTSIIPTRSENSTSGITIESTFTEGGFEVGYPLVNSPYYCFIPSLAFIWSSTGDDISSPGLTNTTLPGALSNPAQFVTLQNQRFSLGISLHNLIKLNMFQFYIRADYFYSPADTWSLKGGGSSSANLIGAPAPNHHRVALTVGFGIGFIENRTYYKQKRKQNSRYQAPTTSRPK